MIKAILVGAGLRGIGSYGEYAKKHPEEIKFVGVAEPDTERRMYFVMQHKIPLKNIFKTDKDIFSREKFADICFICTQDRMHVEMAKQAMDLGYHVFLEKPMAVTPEDCVLLDTYARERNLKMVIGHVLRYTSFFETIKDTIDSGVIGKIMTIQHNENIGYYHFAHSYVRGNWRNEGLSAPSILAKSCHDLDILYWLTGKKPLYLSSVGHLSHFKKENQPDGAPSHCSKGCPVGETCPYNAMKLYTEGPEWMRYAVSNVISKGRVLKAIKDGPYGRCVYESDNDVLDHQVVEIEFEDEITAAFTMSAFTHEISRTIKVMGSLGEIRGNMENNQIEVYTFGKKEPKLIQLHDEESGHSGGDDGIMRALVEYLTIGDNEEKVNVHFSVLSHLLAFAAEDSRKGHRVIDMKEYCERVNYHDEL